MATIKSQGRFRQMTFNPDLSRSQSPLITLLLLCPAHKHNDVTGWERPRVWGGGQCEAPTLQSDSLKTLHPIVRQTILPDRWPGHGEPLHSHTPTQTHTPLSCLGWVQSHGFSFKSFWRLLFCLVPITFCSSLKWEKRLHYWWMKKPTTGWKPNQMLLFRSHFANPNPLEKNLNNPSNA